MTITVNNIDRAPYVRNTETIRVKTGALQTGQRVLTNDVAAQTHDGVQVVSDAHRKTGSIVRVVEDINYVLAAAGFRQRRRYSVSFTDGTRTLFNLDQNVVWHALPVDTASSASRQHFIDTGAYLTPAEVAEFAEPVELDDEHIVRGLD